MAGLSRLAKARRNQAAQGIAKPKARFGQIFRQ
jgi:hypothetical protein